MTYYGGLYTGGPPCTNIELQQMGQHCLHPVDNDTRLCCCQCKFYPEPLVVALIHIQKDDSNTKGPTQ